MKLVSLFLLAGLFLSVPVKGESVNLVCTRESSQINYPTITLSQVNGQSGLKVTISSIADRGELIGKIVESQYSYLTVQTQIRLYLKNNIEQGDVGSLLLVQEYSGIAIQTRVNWFDRATRLRVQDLNCR